jgi:uncharacterized protein
MNAIDERATQPGEMDATAASRGERRGARVLAIDAARGFALLGIFAVNVQSFGEPFGEFILGVPGANETWLGTALFYLVKIFCEGKFYPLFSMLFGIGLVLQMGRAREGGFVGMYLRRLGVLLLIGLIHATLIWYGDILFIYAIAGAALLLASRLSGKTLLGIGVGLVLFVAFACGTLWGGLSAMSERAVESSFTSAGAGVTEAPEAGGVDPTGEADREADAEALIDGKMIEDEAGAAADAVAAGHAAHGRAFSRLLEGLGSGQIQQGPSDPAWIALETQAFADGPWLDAFLFNLMCWAISLMAGLFSYAWHVLGLFFVGAGLMKLGVFERESELGATWRRWLLVVGIGVGVPGAALAAWLPTIAPSAAGYIASTMLLFLCGPMVALMYVCVIWRLADRGVKGGVVGLGIGALARVGRMAMTNYLLHSVIFTGIFHWWGLGLFGELSRPQRLALVPLVYVVLCVTSWVWLKRFRMGPMEWVWRSLTYWKVQAMRHEPGERVA